MSDLLHTVDAKGATSQMNFIAGQESAFWVRVRRNRLLADWFSDLTDENVQSYLKLLLDADFAKVEDTAAEQWILVKIRNDLMGFGIFLSMAEMQALLGRFHTQAVLERAS
ncbi:hypothetical protein CU669_15545 [Paramagnetospirillum kuznetsovii]|uniref:DUF1476 domain-containing protein n=1 Tax=Paramagnetospirillum kuznetsovii TaxID=2053833 RepID=A0A364NV87_9PROT|nr:ATPase inhibitor subunit zeta [Paramagnetospirillum kuznetsovii]RAU20998.1 hypothetical protein CU669_15545 [Paramagnetospirillum kuznetsovii]